MKSTLLTAIVLAAWAAGCSSPSEPPPPDAAAAIAVTTDRVAMVDLPSTLEVGGIVRARVTSPIASRVMAPVVSVHVRAGDRVRRGAPLVSLDALEARANRDRADATATAAEESTVAADADIAAADAALLLARATHRRIADLAARNSATPQELDQAAAALTAAEAQLRSAGARRAAAAASLQAARAASSGAHTAATYTELIAPFDALVSERFVDPGAMATPGMPLITLEDQTSFRLEVRVDESRSAQVQVGQEVGISLGSEAAPRAAAPWMPGRVSEIARVDPASHGFVVKVDLPPDAGVRSGSYGRARFSGPSRKALAIPAGAVVRRGQLAFVFTVDAGHVARLRAVSPGAATGDHIEALAGVSDGEVIVVNPPPALTDGRPVQAAIAVARGDSR